jgi:hypothetical protein
MAAVRFETRSSSGRKVRSTSLAFWRRVDWSQPDTTSESGSSSSAARRTGVISSSSRARCLTKVSIRSESGSERSTGSSDGATRSYCWSATAW